MKRSFIDGSLPRPSLDDLIISYKIWVRCKSMAKSWIMNTRDISILYMQDTATEEIKEKRFYSSSQVPVWATEWSKMKRNIFSFNQRIDEKRGPKVL